MKTDTQNAATPALAVAPCSLPASIDNARWLTSPDQCASADEASLCRSLLTIDGAGRAVKAAALEELLRRRTGFPTSRQPRENAVVSHTGHNPNPTE